MNGNLRNLMGAGFSAGQAVALNGAFATGLTATGATQGTAFLLTSETSVFTTVAASTGARLPAPTDALTPGIGDSYTVFNNGANSLSVYPPVGFSIGTAAANTALAVPANKGAVFYAVGNGNYVALLSA